MKPWSRKSWMSVSRGRSSTTSSGKNIRGWGEGPVDHVLAGRRSSGDRPRGVRFARHHGAEAGRGGVAAKRGTVPGGAEEFSDCGVQPGPGFALYLDVQSAASVAGERHLGKTIGEIFDAGGCCAHHGSPAAGAGNRGGSAP